MDHTICNTSSNIYRGHIRSHKPAVTRTLEPLEEFTIKHIKKKDSNYCIEKLYELTSDPITQDNKLWIHRLLQRFLSEMGTSGYKVKHLPAVTQVLEFLALKVHDVPEYKKPLDLMLDLCIHPPLLEKLSDHLSCVDILVHYFTVLGYLLVIVPENQQIIKILGAIRQLLVRSTPVEITAVKLEFLHRAAEKSRLPSILTDLVEISSLEIIKHILDATFAVASISNSSCHRMLDVGIFNYLLLRFAELTSKNILDEDFLRTYINDDIMILTNTLWLLIKSILPPEKFPPNLQNMSAPDNNAMRSLRNIFQSSIINSKRSRKFLLIRNDLAAIILGGIVALPKWHLVNCGIAEDIIAAAITAIESEESQTSNDDDFIFIKTLLSIICFFSNSGGLLCMIKENYILAKIIRHLNCSTDAKGTRKIYRFSHLVPYKLQTLAFLAPKISDQFVEHGGSKVLLTIFDSCMLMEPMNDHDIMEIAKTICTICTSKSSILLADFHEAGTIPMIYKFIKGTLILEQFSTHQQRVLTFSIIIIECIMLNELKLIEVYGDETIDILIKMMKRCLSGEKNKFPVDERLIIAIGSYIGGCIVWSSTMAKKFIIANGIYIMLDIMDNASLLVRNTYLKTLIDLCTNSQCIPYICTWRDSNKTKGFLSMLARSWREEEITCGVMRTRDGCIEDVELPLMGQNQWYNSFHSRTNHDFSPTITSMIGSIRPKIYSIRKILMTNSELCEKSKEHYKILLDDLPIEDTITFCIVDQYLRFTQGQVWLEVFNYLERVGVNPLGTDGELLLVMSQRHRGCAVYVQERQEKILQDAKRKELIEEHREFERIRDATLNSALKTIKEMDYIRRTTDETYRLKKKKEQISQINKALHFPNRANAEHCHRTFNENWNVTPILNQEHTLTNYFLDSEQSDKLLPPISPSTNSEGSSKN